MNQIEFIKQWAKEGDRVEDNKIRYNVYAAIAQNLNFQMRFSFFNINDIEWQSPKIYRLKITEPLMIVDGVSGYKEKWQLVADYADVVKEEDGALIQLHKKLLSRGVPIPDHDAEMYRVIESRIKALEEKIK